MQLEKTDFFSFFGLLFPIFTLHFILPKTIEILKFVRRWLYLSTFM